MFKAKGTEGFKTKDKGNESLWWTETNREREMKLQTFEVGPSFEYVYIFVSQIKRQRGETLVSGYEG